MARSFTFVADKVDPEISKDGLAAIWNGTTGRAVKVSSIRVSYPTPFSDNVASLTGATGTKRLSRITAMSGGTTQTWAKYDTTTTSLPAQVVLAVFPTSVTETGTPLRYTGDAPSFGLIQTISFQGQLRAPGPLSRDDHEDHDAQWLWGKQRDGNAALQGIVLREGEGVALVYNTYGIPQAYHYCLTIRDTSSGKCYRASITTAGTPENTGMPIWGLMNNTGSGVVLSVDLITYPDMGESNVPQVRLCRIEGLSSDAVASTPVAHDTALGTITGLTCYKGPFKATLAGERDGMPMEWASLVGTSGLTVALQQRAGRFRARTHAPIYGLTMVPSLRFEDENLFWKNDWCCDPITVNPGEGLAVLGGISGAVETSEAAYFTIEFIYTVSLPTQTARPRYAMGV